MKLESPELQGLVQNVLMRWDPALLIDCHTHNGSYHEEPVTYVWNLNPNGDLSIIKYMREQMIPAIKQTLQDEHGVASIPHGDFMDSRDPEKGWVPLGPQPRYLTNYIGLRNRMAILNENYPYVEYKDRVLGCYHFLASCLSFCATHKDDINKMLQLADQRTIQRGLNPTPIDSFAVEYDLKPLDKKITILGYKMEIVEQEGRRPRVRKIDEKITYHIPYFADYVAKRSVKFPYGYLVQPPIPEVTAKLMQHGIVVEQLTKPITVEVEAFKIQQVKSAERLYQGHYTNSVSGKYVIDTKEFPPGTIFVGTAQPLANVAAYLLEPESDDGLLVWNFFDRYIVAQWGRSAQTFPVYRVLKPVNFIKETLLPLN
jgi:dipeptidyl-peptidase-4